MDTVCGARAEAEASDLRSSYLCSHAGCLCVVDRSQCTTKVPQLIGGTTAGPISEKVQRLAVPLTARRSCSSTKEKRAGFSAKQSWSSQIASFTTSFQNFETPRLRSKRETRKREGPRKGPREEPREEQRAEKRAKKFRWS